MGAAATLEAAKPADASDIKEKNDLEFALDEGNYTICKIEVL